MHFCRIVEICALAPWEKQVLSIQVSWYPPSTQKFTVASTLARERLHIQQHYKLSYGQNMPIMNLCQVSICTRII